MKRKICVVTGTRAEYGLLYWLMKALQKDPDIELQIIVTGMHLSPEFGLTYQQIEKDGFQINEKVEMVLSSDTPVGITKSIGLGIIGFADSLARLKPDIMVVLGDRYEVFAAAQAAMVARIPIAHIHGGEITEGAIDEQIRHSITKMAQIHFVANEVYRKRIIQLGEASQSVFNFGAPGLDYINKLKLMSKTELEDDLKLSLNGNSFLITYHPETNNDKSSEDQVKQLISALEEFPEASIVITKANADTNGRIINQLFLDYAKKNTENVRFVDNLGQKRYLSAISHFDVVIGNSSSGIIEVPYLKKPTVNIGVRQQGRLKAKSIIDSICEKDEIIKNIHLSLSQDFQRTVMQSKSLYGKGNTSQLIFKKLNEVKFNELNKKFYDITFD